MKQQYSYIALLVCPTKYVILVSICLIIIRNVALGYLIWVSMEK